MFAFVTLLYIKRLRNNDIEEYNDLNCLFPVFLDNEKKYLKLENCLRFV